MRRWQTRRPDGARRAAAESPALIDHPSHETPPPETRSSLRRRSLLGALLARPLAGIAPLFALWLRGSGSVIRRGWVLAKDD